MMTIELVTLKGRLARLEPLRQDHAAGLYEAIREDQDLWRYIPIRQPRSVEQMEQVVATTLQLQKERVYLPFVIMDLASGRVVGETPVIFSLA